MTMVVVVMMPMVVMMVAVPAVPVVPGIDDHSAAAATVGATPLRGIVMPEARNAVHLLNRSQILGSAPDAGGMACAGRFGTIGERNRHQQRGDRRNAHA